METGNLENLTNELVSQIVHFLSTCMYDAEMSSL